MSGTARDLGEPEAVDELAAGDADEDIGADDMVDDEAGEDADEAEEASERTESASNIAAAATPAEDTGARLLGLEDPPAAKDAVPESRAGGT